MGGSAPAADLGLPPHADQRLYVNERLTKANRQIFGKARELSRTHVWKFVWTREGHVKDRERARPQCRATGCAAPPGQRTWGALEGAVLVFTLRKI
ncbi:unnamed protein product [Plutella xylostella]|uniref:(diamondback moth) hypothetical protein n=1 Tax=Plutella xylostella TaxID=51655 RepID=A0A8S4GD26_PLUXY|nr:unnamed protein product [Plutella xylostella]